MLTLSRTPATSTSLAAALVLTLFAGTAAQVATLASPDETEAPAADPAAADLEFADRTEGLLVFAQCMRDNGIEMDDPQTGPGDGGGPGGGFLRPPDGAGFDELGDDFLVARAACSAILEAARPELDPEAEQERLEQELVLAQCFRDNGYELYPDPVIGSDGRLQRAGQQFLELGIDRRSEQFQIARETCAETLGLELAPDGGRGPGGS